MGITALFSCLFASKTIGSNGYESGCWLFVYGTFLITVGVLLSIEDGKVIEYRRFYTLSEGEKNISIVMDKTMPGPVYVFLELTNFYQNSRSLTNSLSRRQLLNLKDGRIKTECEGAFNISEYSGGLKDYKTGYSIDPKYEANPCGFLAKNFPFDEYLDIENDSKGVTYHYGIDPHNIHLQMSGTVTFVPTMNESSSPQWLNVTDMRFNNWMKTSSTATFMNLWGIINSTIQAGTYSINLRNRLDETKFDGKKAIVFSTSNVIGGKNSVTFMAFFTVGGLLFFSSIVLCLIGFKREPLRMVATTDDEEDEGMALISQYQSF